MIPLSWKLGAAGAIVALVIGGFFWQRAHYINLGWDRAMAKVKAVNQEARNAADEASRKRRACLAAGGVWSQIADECD